MSTEWRATTDASGTTVIVRITDAAGAPIAYGEAMAALGRDRARRAFLTGALAAAPFDAFYWETPPVTIETLDRPLEMALVDAPPLARTEADPSAFADRFDGEPVVTFPNLGGDAVLVVPAPLGPEACYAHLAAFVRRAPEAQTDALWSSVARAVLERVSGAPLWLSTAGLGVPWLHVRLDARPKYYRHTPYARRPRRHRGS